MSQNTFKIIYLQKYVYGPVIAKKRLTLCQPFFENYFPQFLEVVLFLFDLVELAELVLPTREEVSDLLLFVFALFVAVVEFFVLLIIVFTSYIFARLMPYTTSFVQTSQKILFCLNIYWKIILKILLNVHLFFTLDSVRLRFWISF